jgi:hypothetical protein
MSNATFEPTEKRPGHKVLSLHRVQVINDRGGAEPIAPIPGPAPLLVNAHPQWPSLHVWALMGLAMGALLVWGIVS